MLLRNLHPEGIQSVQKRAHHKHYHQSRCSRDVQCIVCEESKSPRLVAAALGGVDSPCPGTDAERCAWSDICWWAAWRRSIFSPRHVDSAILFATNLPVSLVATSCHEVKDAACLSSSVQPPP